MLVAEILLTLKHITVYEQKCSSIPEVKRAVQEVATANTLLDNPIDVFQLQGIVKSRCDLIRNLHITTGYA